MNAKVEQFTRGFFWFGYAVFLSASIPHIAAYFRHFDPANGNQIENIFYWVIAVLLAVVIDVSDVLVSIAVMKAQASGAKWRDNFGYWFFIVFIMLLSWFLNYQYNVVFGTSEFHAVDKQIIFGSVTIGDVNPVVGSAFQLLLLVYTGMAHKFAQKPKVVDLKELAKQAEEAKLRAGYQAQIDAVNDAQRAQKRQSFFSNLKDLKQGVTQVISGSNEADPADVSDVDEEELEQSIDEETDVQSEVLGESTDVGQTTPMSASKSTRNRSTKRVFVTVEEAAEMLQYDLQYVKTLRTREVLKTSGKNKNLITIASINAVLNSKQGKRKNQSKDDHTASIESAQSGVHSEQNTDAINALGSDDGSIERLLQSASTPKYGADNEMDMITTTLEIMRGNSAITDEELRAALGLKTVGMARLWKVKAQSLLEQEQQVAEETVERVPVG